MNQAALVEMLRPLPRRGRIRLADQVARLRRLCHDSPPRDEFFEGMLKILIRLFDASSAGFWVVGSDPSRPRMLASAAAEIALPPGLRGSASGEEGQPEPALRADPAALAAVAERAIHAAGETDRPCFVPLLAPPCALLLAPLRAVVDERVAVHLVLPRGEGNEGTDGVMTAGEVALQYERAIRATVVALQPTIQRRMRERIVAPAAAEAQMQQLTRQIHSLQRSIRRTIELQLRELVGASLGSLEENQRFVRSVRELLDAHGLRVRCPECGHPAILRCVRNASAAQGVFVFDHYIEGRRTFHGGGALLPRLRIIAKPARRGAQTVINRPLLS